MTNRNDEACDTLKQVILGLVADGTMDPTQEEKALELVEQTRRRMNEKATTKNKGKGQTYKD